MSPEKYIKIILNMVLKYPQFEQIYLKKCWQIKLKNRLKIKIKFKNKRYYYTGL